MLSSNVNETELLFQICIINKYEMDVNLYPITRLLFDGHVVNTNLELLRSSFFRFAILIYVVIEKILNKLTGNNFFCSLGQLKNAGHIVVSLNNY